MATEREYINYKDFVESLDEATPSANDKAVFNDANGPKGSVFSAIAAFVHNAWAAFVNALTVKTSFASGDKIPVVNGSTATAMEASKLLELTAQNALAGNVAPVFDPTRTSENPYKAGESVSYEGKTYIFKVPHYGAWTNSHAVQKPLAETAMKVMLEQIYSGNTNNLADLNDAEPNSVYVISRDSNTTTLNFPTEFSGEGFLHTYKSFFNTSTGHFIFQILVQPASSNIWIRRYNSVTSSWGDWEFSNTQRVSDKQIYANWNQNLSDLNDADINKIYVLQPTASTTTQHLPDGLPKEFSLLLTQKASYSSSHYQIVQTIVSVTDNSYYYRMYNTNGNSWSPWYNSKAMHIVPRQIFANWSRNLADLNDAAVDAVYVLQPTSATTTQNLPDGLAGMALLFAQKAYYSDSYYQIVQSVISLYDGVHYYRAYNSNGASWSQWYRSNPMSVNPKQIYATWNQNLADLNDADVNAMYVLQPTASTNTQHLPDGFKGHQGLMFTAKANFSTSNYQTWQIIFRFDNSSIYYRAYNSNISTWSQWYTSEPDTREKIYVGAGETYTSLRSALEYAYTHHNVDVHVKKGTYDLAADFATEIATHESGTTFGAPLGHGCYYFFEPGAKVLAMCEKGDLSNDQWGIVNVYFNPLDAKGSDFTIEGLDIEAQDCRYCVHDDNGSVSTPYSHTYKNCRMVKHCTSNVASNKQFTQCIGGGFGKTATINVDGGWYKSEAYWGYADIDNGNVDQNQMCISYHNGRGEGYQSVVFVKDVFIADRGYVAAIDLDVSTSVSQFYVCGCRLGLPSQHQEGPTHNTAITTWNCDIANEGTWVPSGDDDWKVSWVPANP